MSDRPGIEDELQELIDVQHEIEGEADHPEIVRPLTERSAELTEDIHEYELAEREAVERRETPS